MLTILIVDDSRTARMFIKRCLEIAVSQDAEFLEAANGKEALGILKAQPADLVVSDLNMPVMDGDMLVKFMKASPKLNEIPIMIITSAGNPAKETELLALGAFAVLSKPVSPATITETLGSLIQKEEGAYE
ncbi:response regulator [Thermodesulfobacteriota bacterium]